MKYQLKVDMPNLPKGELVSIPGLGEFENGNTYDIDDEKAEAYRWENFQSKEVLDGNKKPTGEVKRVAGPTVLQALKGAHGLTVTTAQEELPEEETPEVEDEAPQEEVFADGGALVPDEEEKEGN